MRMAKKAAILIVKAFVSKSSKIDKNPKKIKNIHASKIVNAPVASGRPTVLVTNLSIL